MLDTNLLISDFTVIEGDENYKKAKITVELDKPIFSEVVTINYSTYGITAFPGVDYKEKENKKIEFDPGETKAKFTVRILSDQTQENTFEQFGVRFSSNQARIFDDSLIVNIRDDDGENTIPKPNLLISDYSITEGDEDEKKAKITVSLDQAPLEKVRVFYSTYNLTAIEGEDYKGKVDKKITFKPGQTEKTFNVKIYGDEDFENDETLAINFESDDVNITDEPLILTILNDDSNTNVIPPPSRW